MKFIIVYTGVMMWRIDCTVAHVEIGVVGRLDVTRRHGVSEVIVAAGMKRQVVGKTVVGGGGVAVRHDSGRQEVGEETVGRVLTFRAREAARAEREVAGNDGGPQRRVLHFLFHVDVDALQLVDVYRLLDLPHLEVSLWRSMWGQRQSGSVYLLNI